MKPEELAAFKHAKADALTAPIAGQVYYEFSGEGACEPCLEPFLLVRYIMSSLVRALANLVSSLS